MERQQNHFFEDELGANSIESEIDREAREAREFELAMLADILNPYSPDWRGAWEAYQKACNIRALVWGGNFETSEISDATSELLGLLETATVNEVTQVRELINQLLNKYPEIVTDVDNPDRYLAEITATLKEDWRETRHSDKYLPMEIVYKWSDQQTSRDSSAIIVKRG